MNKLTMYMLGISLGFAYRTIRALRIDRPRAYRRGVQAARAEAARFDLEPTPAPVTLDTFEDADHPFRPYPGNQFPRSCMQCGRIETAMVHMMDPVRRAAADDPRGETDR